MRTIEIRILVSDKYSIFYLIHHLKKQYILLQIGGFAVGDSNFEELLKVAATHQIWLENSSNSSC